MRPVLPREPLQALRCSGLPVSPPALREPVSRQRAERFAGQVWPVRSGQVPRFWLPLSPRVRRLQRSSSPPQPSLRRGPSRQTDLRPTVRPSLRWPGPSVLRSSASWRSVCGREPGQALRSRPRRPLRPRRVLHVWISEIYGRRGTASHTPRHLPRLRRSRPSPHSGRCGVCCVSPSYGRRASAFRIPRRPHRLQTRSRHRHPVWSCRRSPPGQRRSRRS